jgi:hypothetical protein
MASDGTVTFFSAREMLPWGSPGGGGDPIFVGLKGHNFLFPARANTTYNIMTVSDKFTLAATMQPADHTVVDATQPDAAHDQEHPRVTGKKYVYVSEGGTNMTTMKNLIIAFAPPVVAQTSIISITLGVEDKRMKFRTTAKGRDLASQWRSPGVANADFELGEGFSYSYRLADGNETKMLPFSLDVDENGRNMMKQHRVKGRHLVVLPFWPHALEVLVVEETGPARLDSRFLDFFLSPTAAATYPASFPPPTGLLGLTMSWPPLDAGESQRFIGEAELPNWLSVPPSALECDAYSYVHP